MNEQELIKEFEEIGIHGLNMFGTVVKGIPTETAIDLIKQLDEPDTGHADEAPRYLKNLLARLRELPLHNREVWLKVIMSEFKQDFSNAKWREGYEQGKLEGMVERNKVKVKKFVADWIEEARKSCKDVAELFDFNFTNEEVGKWFMQEQPFDLVARAWLDGYEVEEEKRYLVKLKNNSEEIDYLVDTKTNGYRFFSNLYTQMREHTRKQLEEAGFGWVFDCPGIEIEEVEE